MGNAGNNSTDFFSLEARYKTGLQAFVLQDLTQVISRQTMDRKSDLNSYISSSISSNWDRLALTDFDGSSFQYRDVARKIAKLHILYKETGIKQGDKIALCGKNSAQWSIAFLSIVTYGAVAVPILHDFKPDNIHHLVSHSEARLLFTDMAIWENLEPDSMNELEGSIMISDYSLLLSRSKKLTEARNKLNLLFGTQYPDRFTAEDVKYNIPDKDNLAVINYTSGSTGFSKGVMLSYGNLWSNLQYTIDGLNFLLPGDGIVCMLPLAHMFGLMVELLHPFVKGCHISFLTRTPSPRVILEAFARVKPKLVVTVPLIIEKIIRSQVFPKLEKPAMKLLLSIPVIDNKILDKIKTSLIDVFGGNMQEIIIGGAGLNHEVEKFLRKINFPFTVGYGMTECGPLVAYAPWDIQREGSCGKSVDRMETRIDSPDPINTPGILWVKGDNVMKGYYKNDEATSAVFADGWMNTGDICQYDKDGFIYIRGRDKNMILGPSGQNIYPEEIELKLNALPYVSESLIVERDGKLIAHIYPDMDNAKKQNISDSGLNDIMKANIAELNHSLPAYSHVADYKLRHEEFEKTPKRSIKRYLYQH